MLAQIQQSLSGSSIQQGWQLTNKRLVVPVVLAALLLTESTRELTIGVLSDAFWQVAAYVAATLALFHYLTERFDKTGLFQAKLASSTRLQVLFAAFMGALPGCGGAIVVVTQYVKGNLSFGGVVAVLTATMGDAAFLLLASKPVDGLLIMALGFVVGVVSGLIVDKTHGADFMRPKLKVDTQKTAACNKASECNTKVIKIQGTFWQWMLLPAMTFAILGSFQVDTDQLFGMSEGATSVLGAIAAMVALTLWATTREITDYESAVAEDPKANSAALFQRVAQDTNFVTSWVIAAFLVFELAVYWFDINLATLFSDWAPLMPLMGVVIGLLPGCGPQILVTSLYVSGSIPMSAQVGNAISNDGDALFPAIALAPKAAIMATLYSTIPALIAAYSYFALFE